MYSIIIPAYNCEKYLAKCLDSIINQEFTAWEVILVNDGSTDQTLEIANKYAAKDSRIKVVSKNNEGVSAARNLGIQLAAYDKLLFCDSDDHYSEDFLSKCYSHDMDADCFIFGYYEDLYDGNAYMSSTAKVYSDSSLYLKTTLKSAFEKLCSDELIASAWDKIYKRNILIENAITFDEESVCYEDYLFNLDYLKHCKNIGILNLPLYHYRMTGKESYLGKRKFKNLFSNSCRFAQGADAFARKIFQKKCTEISVLHYNSLYLFLFEAHTHLNKGEHTYKQIIRTLNACDEFKELLTSARGKMLVLLRICMRMNLLFLEKNLILYRFRKH